MRTLYKILKHNTTPRLIVGGLVCYFVYSGTLGQDNREVPQEPRRLIRVAKAALPSLSTGQDISNQIIELAKTDHIKLLNLALENYQKQIYDYQGTLFKQERINNKLRKIEQIAVSFKERPFSLLMKWEKNAGVIDKLLFVEGSNDDKMVVHPTGLLAWIKSVKRDPRSEQARRSSRRTCDEFGFYRSMLSILEMYEQAQQHGDLEIGYVGPSQVDGRDCIAMERILPAKNIYPCHRFIMEFDLEYLLPTSVTSYDWQGNLLTRYVYKNLQFNYGLSDNEFTCKFNDL